MWIFFKMRGSWGSFIVKERENTKGVMKWNERERERGMWGRWVKKSGAQENPPRDTGEVSRGAFPLGVKSCGAYHILSRWGRVVAISKERAISFDSLLRFASHAHPSSTPSPSLLIYHHSFHTIPYHTIPFMHPNQFFLHTWQNLTRPINPFNAQPGSIPTQSNIICILYLGWCYNCFLLLYTT